MDAKIKNRVTKLILNDVLNQHGQKEDDIDIFVDFATLNVWLTYIPPRNSNASSKKWIFPPSDHLKEIYAAAEKAVQELIEEKEKAKASNLIPFNTL